MQEFFAVIGCMACLAFVLFVGVAGFVSVDTDRRVGRLENQIEDLEDQVQELESKKGN